MGGSRPRVARPRRLEASARGPWPRVRVRVDPNPGRRHAGLRATRVACEARARAVCVCRRGCRDAALLSAKGAALQRASCGHVGRVAHHVHVRVECMLGLRRTCRRDAGRVCVHATAFDSSGQARLSCVCAVATSLPEMIAAPSDHGNLCGRPLPCGRAAVGKGVSARASVPTCRIGIACGENTI